MKETVIQAIEKRFGSFSDLVDYLTEEQLAEKLPVSKSKSLQEHLWCVVGARESYTRALKQGQWAGFSCSLNDLKRDSLLDSLKTSAQGFAETVSQIESWDSEREALLVALLEHEVMHEGQIIRHIYGLGQTLPASWRWA